MGIKSGMIVLSAAALIAAGGVGTATAAKLISGQEIKDGSITSRDLSKGVNRQLKRILNTTATDVVNRARMDYAGRRLVMSDDKIVSISLQCGLSNLGHFYQLFKQRFGMSPGRYRRRKSSVVHDPHADDR